VILYHRSLNGTVVDPEKLEGRGISDSVAWEKSKAMLMQLFAVIISA